MIYRSPFAVALAGTVASALLYATASVGIALASAPPATGGAVAVIAIFGFLVAVALMAPLMLVANLVGATSALLVGRSPRAMLVAGGVAAALGALMIGGIVSALREQTNARFDENMSATVALAIVLPWLIAWAFGARRHSPDPA